MTKLLSIIILIASVLYIVNMILDIGMFYLTYKYEKEKRKLQAELHQLKKARKARIRKESNFKNGGHYVIS